MNQRVKAFVGLAALVMIGVGLWLGLSTHQASTGSSCGSAFDPRDTSAYDAGRELGAFMSGGEAPAPSADECRDLLDPTPAIVLIAAGALASGVWLWKPTTERSSRSTRS